jgi:hypothetical protein
MIGVRFERCPTWDDVWVDGSLAGTVHSVPGGWAFYLAGLSRVAGHVPAAVAMTRYDAVMIGLRTAGEPSAGMP